MARIVKDQVDGGGLYFSRAAAGGPFVFMASVAVNNLGELAEEARVLPPYNLSPSAHVRRQTQYVFERYERALEELGSSIKEIVQVEQYIPRKAYGDGYIEASRGPGLLERERPTSALMATGDFAPDACVVNPTAIAVITGDGLSKEILPPDPSYEGLIQPEFGDTYEEPPFNEIISVGPYVFTVGDAAVDFNTGRLPDEVRVPDWIWWGSEIRNEARFLLERSERRLGRVGSSLADVVHATVYLADIADLYELDLAWKRYFPTDPPARTVVPVRNLGVGPRREGPNLGHFEGAVKFEPMFQSIRPGLGVKKEAFNTSQPLSHESEAVRAGALLWVSGQLAGSLEGARAGADARGQLDYIFERIEGICAAGGTSIENALRIRAFVTDVADTYAVHAAVRDAFRRDPPCVAVAGVPAPLQFPECSVIVDAVAYVPE